MTCEKKDRKNEELYKSTFDRIHASEELLGKVKSMNNNSKKKTFWVRKLGVAAAAAAIILVSSNAVAYACTGTTWFGKVVVSINGKETEMDAKYTTLEGGKVVEIELPEDMRYEIELPEDMDENVELEYSETTEH